jgi:biopolymer transport protein ExbD
MGPMSGGGLTREPNVVPMIDILLVLLIAAILWAIPEQHWKAEVSLPVPITDPGPHVDVAKIVLSVSPGPRYAVNGRSIAGERLIAELTGIYAGRPERVLFIDAERAVPYRDVFWLYGAVKDAGVAVVAIVPPETRRPAATTTR